MTIISEAGLYKVLRYSRKPEAKAVADRFDRWVRHDVLPTIRKVGSYGISPLPETAIEIVRIVTAGLKEAIAPLGVRLESQDGAIERIEKRQDAMAEDVAAIKARLSSRRVNLTAATKAEYIDAIQQLGGRCPCGCGAIVVENGVKSRFAEFDHFYAVNRADAAHTWLIAKTCNTEFNTGRRDRREYEASFRAYQHARLRLPNGQKNLFG